MAIARVKHGDLSITGEVNERLPAITNGLVAHFSFDGKSGLYDNISNITPTQGVLSGEDLIQLTGLDWKDPNNWTKWTGTGTLSWDPIEQALVADGYWWGWFNGYVYIDTSKHWYVEANAKKIGSTGTFYLGDISYNINKTTTPQHPGTHEYFGATGVIVPTTWTKYKNNAIGGVARTGTGTTTTNYNVFDPNCCYVRPLFIANYSTGVVGTDKTYVKNIKFYYTDVDNSNTTITYDGVAVEESTTNIITNGDFTNGTNFWNVNQNVTFNIIQENSQYMAYVVSNQTGSTPGLLTNLFNVTPNTQYTISMWGYKDPSTTVHVYVQGNGSGQLLWTGDFTNELSRVSLTFTTGASDTQIKVGPLFSGCVVGSWMKFTKVQVEQRSSATSFINGTRAKGQLSINNPFQGTAGTIHIKAKMTNGDPYSLQYKSLFGNVPSNNAFFVFVEQGSGVLYGYFPNISNSHTYYSFNYYPNYNEEIIVTLTWNANIFKYYLNGVLKGISDVCDSARIANSFTTLYLGSHPNYNCFGLIKSLSIYNRDLSDAEIIELCNIKINFNSNGNMNFLITEKSSCIPNDAIYYQLGFNTMDNSKIFSASEASNLVYENQGVWVGSDKTNLCVRDLYNWTNLTTMTRNCTEIPPFNSNYEVVKIQANTMGTEGQAIPWTTPITPVIGDVYSHSAYIYMTVGTYAKVGQHWNPWDYGVPNYIPLNKWVRVEYKCALVDTSHTSIANNYSTDGIIYVTMPQYEKLYLTPFVNGTRSKSSLEYNLNSSIGLDWSQDWSICYWKKPIGTHTDTLTGYNLESLGCNSNSVGTGYVYWGKSNSADTIYGSTPSTLDPNKYFGTWRFISLVKTGTTITIKEWSPSEGEYVRTASTTNTVANYYVTQYGYDLRLGGWDNTNSSNSYFRDLIIVKRALSNSEISNLRQIQLSELNSKLYLQNHIIENQIL